MNTNAASPPPPRWSTSAAAMLVALASAFALSQAFRTVGAMMATPLGSHFGLSPQQLGTWAGTFHFMFGIMQLAMGVSIDMFGVRRTVLTAFPLAIAGAVLCTVADSFHMLLLGQALIGVGCAPAFLACTVFIARHFDAARFTAMSGLVMSMAGLGIVFTGTPLALLIEAASWRAGYAVLAAAAVLSWLIIFWRVREPVRAVADQVDPTERQSLRKALRELLPLFAMPHTLGLLCFACVSYAAFITLRGLWLGPVLHERHGLSLVASGNVALVMTITGMISPALFGRLDPGAARRARWMIGCATAGALMFAAMALTHSRAIDIGLPIVYGLLSGYSVLQYAYTKNAYPAAMTGRALALMNMAMFLGVSLMQWTTGVAASWGVANGVEPFRAVFLTVAGMLAMGTVAFLVLPRAVAPVRPG
ncbi:putative MFS family arabinose efflux permease [Variovorax boronicumulans]|uniref:Lysosomal dipeptide transporter MFSD1 n=1 Tax=Variovorax boronicumulans TaxID=436515 RepID=A0AAW8D6D3_9BURK|nr:MFS transporter [Variovorax boronicumulans]MDP9896612.1 putative MFS family arabinose efflux permease [Variovorax boronicumulans]MDQ0044047.1 putative MFS family arabinose efflux permease [Variovorax boronicumulans]MDQ0056605.1 putative MFS family arabinose efflux permease [Variovorax boronicumulans]